MKLKNAKLYGQEAVCDITIQGDLIQTITPANPNEKADENEIDLNGNIVLTPYDEPHIHLDYALTAGTPRWNQSGSVFKGNEIWSERKQDMNETKEDIKQRDVRVVHMKMKHDMQYVTTHTVISNPTL